MIAVSMDGYLLQINFTDGFDKEDYSEIFETMIGMAPSRSVSTLQAFL